VYTSARLKTQVLFSFQYGRLEFRSMVPEAQGLGSNWLMGNNIATVNWPACGEMDVLERVNAPLNPDWNAGSIHGTDHRHESRFHVPHQANGRWCVPLMTWSAARKCSISLMIRRQRTPTLHDSKSERPSRRCGHSMEDRAPHHYESAIGAVFRAAGQHHAVSVRC
jgi:hypothetical protein